jgi:hypothetical protein
MATVTKNRNFFKWSKGLLDTILKGTHPGTIPARFGLIWFSGFRGEDLNVIFYQNMPNLHNRYKSTERKISTCNQTLVEWSLDGPLPKLCPWIPTSKLKIEKRGDEILIVHCCYSCRTQF